MRHMKKIFYIGVIPSFLVMMFLGTLYGASVTMHREGSLQDGQESAVTEDHVNRALNQPTFAPQSVKDKTDPGAESGTANRSVKMERYKPYREGEGERKIR